MERALKARKLKCVTIRVSMARQEAAFAVNRALSELKQ